MLISLKNLNGYTIKAKDGDIGKVKDFYFDDEHWVTRYMVADTGKWLPGRKVLIAPAAFLGHPDGESKAFPVVLTKDMIKESPDISTKKPVSRQEEIQMMQYYGWPAYWGVIPEEHLNYPPITQPKIPEDIIKKGDSHLRSTHEVSRYYIHAADGDIGHAEDFIVDDETWNIRYLVADTKNLLPGKKVLVAPQWITKVSWNDIKVTIDLPRESIKNSPEYDPSQAVNRIYEEGLYDYYGRPKYWT